MALEIMEQVESVKAPPGHSFLVIVAAYAMAHGYHSCTIGEAGSTTLLLCKDNCQPMMVMVKEHGERMTALDWEWIDRWRSNGLLAVPVRPREYSKIKRLMERKPGVLLALDGEEMAG